MRRGVDGIQLPEAALVCNFSPSPQRLAHDEVTTFFHEFGHLMHNMVAGENQAWNQFSGLSMAWDFVEARGGWVSRARTCWVRVGRAWGVRARLRVYALNRNWELMLIP